MDNATFRDRGTGKFFLSRDNGTPGKEVPSLSRDKGTVGRAQNLAMERDGIAKIRDGTGRDSQNPGRDEGQNRTEQKRMF